MRKISPRDAARQRATLPPNGTASNLLSHLLNIKHTPAALFAREMLRNPRGIGAAWPSSSRLAQAMAQYVPLEEESGLVLELGAGTGVVTEALLKRGIAPERLVVVELAAGLVHHLRHRFPQLRVLEGDACHLQKLIQEDYTRIGTVVSSLPLRSLPRPMVQAISTQLHPLLERGAALVQFTYDLRGHPPPCFETLPGLHLNRTASHIIWRNLPPARVDVFHLRSRKPQ